MYFDRKCKITFIANGATIYSDENRFSDVENYPPLSEEGIEEINKICDFLKKRAIKNDKIISSSALRTVQTAKLVSKVFKQDFEITDNLKTRAQGEFNGFTFDQIEQKYPQAFSDLINNPNIATPSNAETISKFVSRISKSIKKIVKENNGS